MAKEVVGLGLVRYDAMVLAIDACERVDEAKEIRDKARALEVYAKQAMNLGAESKAAKVRIRAEKKAGELVLSAAKHKGGRPGNRSNETTGLKLSDIGISKDQSSKWQKLAEIPKEQFEKALEVDSVPTTKGVLRTVAVAKKHAHRESLAIRDVDTCTIADLTLLAGKDFGTIYADPPWLYGNQGTRAATGNHYGGLTVEEICALPVQATAAQDAHLHLWTTNAFLFEAKRVLEAWGFEYKSCFVWVKPSMGIGNYWRVSHEFLLLGTRGKAEFRNHSLMSWGNFPRTKHSSKPGAVRKQIESASPGPYLELFGRRVATGWAVWGDQIRRDVFDQEVEEVTA